VQVRRIDLMNEWPILGSRQEPTNVGLWVFAMADLLQAARRASVAPHWRAQRTSPAFPPSAALAAANPSIMRNKTLISVNRFNPFLKVLGGGLQFRCALAFCLSPSMPATAR
jgi:hypothetical protein